MTIPSDRSDQIFSSQPIKAGSASQAAGAGFSAGPSQAQAKPFAQQAQAPSSVQAPSFAGPAAGPSFDTLIAQVGTSQDSLTNIRNQLNTKNLQFKRSQQHLLRNKLSDASTHLRAANARMGGGTPPMPTRAGARPVERFLNYVTDGETQLASVQQQIQDIQSKGGELRPGDFLLIQIKLSQAQQELEYSSILLSKVIDSITKTLNIAL